MTDQDAIAQLATDQVLAITLYGEGRSEPIEGRIAIASVIRNRVNADIGNDARPDWWGEGYRGVCLAPMQFSCWQSRDGEQNYQDVIATVRSTVNGSPIGPILRECAWIAFGIMGGEIRDRVKGSTHYLTADLFRVAPPKWAKGRTPVARVGAHLFFTGVA